MEKVSKHITYAEATSTSTGVDNTPSHNQLEIMKGVAENLFEPLREGLGNNPIRLNSFFRSKSVNKAIGGAHRIVDGKYIATSQHCKGMAIDMDGIKSTNAEIFFFILDNLDFDQLIWEKGDDTNPDWIHASWKPNNRRKQVLIFDGKSYSTYKEGMLVRPTKKKKVGRPKKSK